MSNSMKDTLANAGRDVADAAKNVGDKIAKGAENAVEFVKDKTGMNDTSEGTNVGVAGIKHHMKVIASCGKTVGVVDGVEGNAIKLTRKDSPDGMHHFVPVSWVDHVDSHVHLTKNSKEAEENWKSDAAACCHS